MKKLLFPCLTLLTLIVFSSFVSEGEAGSSKVTCDASNSASCKVVFTDGTTVDATGVAKVISTP